jgi:2-succinyl-6-hydroxy-2,4-cyclohexadiene-1-carboxylate synthase
MKLAAERLAASQPSRGRLVLVHGFTQTRSSWDPIAMTLNSDGYEVVAVDAPGHGESDELQLDVPASAAALGDTGGLATYIGYSMGGRITMQLAVASPERVSRLVLVSATAGIEDDEERGARRAADEQRAEEVERDGVAAFLDRWLSLPMFTTLSPAAAGLQGRRANTAAGLAASLRLAGTGAQRPLWSDLAALSMPVLIVAGALDHKFSAIAARMAGLIPNAELAVVAGAGHAVHLERQNEFVDALRRWLEATSDVSRRPHRGS